MTQAHPPIDDIVARLKVIIAEDLDLQIDPDSISESVSLLEEGLGLDSIALVEFIDLLEERFDIMLDDGALTTRHFQSIRDLAAFIATLLPGEAQ